MNLLLIALAEQDAELALQKTALIFVHSFSDEEYEVNLNKINPEVKNTLVLCNNRTIVNKYVELKATPGNFRMVNNF